MEQNIGQQLHEHLLLTSPEIQEILLGQDLDTTATVLGKLYGLPIDKFVILKNIITFILLGIIKPEEAVAEIQKNLLLKEEISISLAKDLDSSILQKTRLRLFGGDQGTVKVLQIKDSSPTKEALREEIMINTKLNSSNEKENTEIFTTPREEKFFVSPPLSSHDQLLEQLEILENVPKDDEVEARLSKIREQVANIQKNNTEKEEVEHNIQQAEVAAFVNTVHKPTFPETYEIDPYRETADTV